MKDRQTQHSGFFVTFEGIDACGKSTQAELLYKYLHSKGLKVRQLRDPGTTAISEVIRTILLDNKNAEMSAWTELLLYEAARAQMVEENIKPALAQGTIVLCDRYYDSTTAYQGYGRGLNINSVIEANQIGSLGIVPDLTFLIDVKPNIAVERKKNFNARSDRLESEGIQFQERVRKGYLQLSQNEPDRIITINGQRSIQTIHEQIKKIFNEKSKFFQDKSYEKL